MASVVKPESLASLSGLQFFEFLLRGVFRFVAWHFVRSLLVLHFGFRVLGRILLNGSGGFFCPGWGSLGLLRGLLRESLRGLLLLRFFLD